MNKVRYFLCHCLGWHTPENRVIYDEFGWHSRCKYCGKFIVEDSQGNWI